MAESQSVHPSQDVVALIFSKDRAMQLQACLESLSKSLGIQSTSVKTTVLYKCSTSVQFSQYERLKQEWSDVDWVYQSNFLFDLKGILESYRYVLFLVDDTVFVQKWSLEDVLSIFNCERVLGVSLRLGRNTHYCFPLDRNQQIPALSPVETSSLNTFDWTEGEYDFNYPIEVSSSVFRTQDMLTLLREARGIYNPNYLEYLLDSKKNLFSDNKHLLACYDQSVAFSNPLNLVQSTASNRVAEGGVFSARELQTRFDAGLRMDLEKWWGICTRGAHQSEAPEFVKRGSVQKSEVDDAIDPIISVVIPCYNYGKYIREAVESVWSQTLAGIELIVVDGGSNDPFTLSELERLQREGVNVQFREGRHLVGDNRNFGIEQARGKLICCLDADDKLDQSYLEKAVFKLVSGGLDIVGSSALVFGNEDRMMGVPASVSYESLLERNQLQSASVFKKELWSAVGGYYDFGLGEDHIHEDWHFWCKCAKAGAKIANISDETLIHYRTHSSGSLSSQKGVVPNLVEQQQVIADSLKGFSPSSRSSSESDELSSLTSSVSQAFQLTRHARSKSPLLLLVDAYSSEKVDELEKLIEPYRDQDVEIVVFATDSEDLSSEWYSGCDKAFVSSLFRLPFFLSTEKERREFIEFFITSRAVSTVLSFGSKLFKDNYRSWESHCPNCLFLESNFVLDGVLDLARGREFLFDEGGSSQIPMERIRITGTGTKDTRSMGSEIWLLDIVDAEYRTLMVPELKLLISQGWEMRKSEGSPRGFALLCQSEEPLELMLPAGSYLHFLTHPYSGNIVVENLSHGDSVALSLFHETGDIVKIPLRGFESIDAVFNQCSSEKAAVGQEVEMEECRLEVVEAEASNRKNEVCFVGITDKNNNPVPSQSVDIQQENGWETSVLPDRLAFGLLGRSGNVLFLRFPKGSLLHFYQNPEAGCFKLQWGGRETVIDLFRPEFSKCRVDLEEIEF